MVAMNRPTLNEGPVSGRLAHLGLLRVEGPDAASFLQGQVSNDVGRLSDPAPVLAALSSPQGRVLAILHLMPHASGVLAVLPRELVSPTLERLRKYVLRAKVRLEDVSEAYGVVGLHAADRAAVEAFESARLPDLAAARYAETHGIGVAVVAGDPERRWLVGLAPALDEIGIGGPHAAQPAQRIAREWRLADIRCGLPQIYAVTRELFVAQMLNLDLLDGISFTKGCYTGQEIIARTQHLGRIKRRLFRLRLPAGAWTIGQTVRLRDGRSGRLTEVVGAEALAVLTMEPSSAGEPGEPGEPGEAEYGAPSIEAVELPLPYSPRGAGAAPV
jgi:folate-binding protein YgfZ